MNEIVKKSEAYVRPESEVVMFKVGHPVLDGTGNPWIDNPED